MYFNLLALAAFTLYHFNTDITKQTAIAYTSTIITFILLAGVVIYHVTLLTKKEKTSEEENEYPLGPVQPASSKVTCSVVEIPKPQCPPPEPSSDKTIQDITDRQNVTPPYQ